MKGNSDTKIFHVVFQYLLRVLLGITVLGGITVSVIMYHRAMRQVRNTIQENVSDVSKDLSHMVDSVVRNGAKAFTHAIKPENEYTWSYDYLEEVVRMNDTISEANVLDASGIVIGSSRENLAGYDMSSDPKSLELLRLLESEEETTIEMPSLDKNTDVMMHYGGVKLGDDWGYILVGIDENDLRTYTRNSLGDLVINRHIGQNGTMVICDEDGMIVDSYGGQYNGEAVNLQLEGSGSLESKIFRGTLSFILTDSMEGYTVIGLYPVSDVRNDIMVSVGMNIVLCAVLFLLLLGALSWVMNTRVVKGVVSLNNSLTQIAEGNLDVKADVRSTYEFSSLSDDINKTVDSLKGYIAREAARIDQDLAYAREIQRSTLPSVFPPFPDRGEFDLFASMDTAKEVGGDFFDFYLLNRNTLTFLVADVSGKGIPAAMFMMTGKTVLRDYAERGDEPAEVLFHANEHLCAGNEAGMFITAWMGFFDIQTGLVRFVNAGHNPPVLMRKGEKAEFLEQKRNLFLAVFDGTVYQEQRLTLDPGDTLFLYTDGVTEAINPKEEMFGEERLLEVLSTFDGEEDEICQAVCRKVKEEVDRFAGKADQFDDITMLCLHYNGNNTDSAAVL